MGSRGNFSEMCDVLVLTDEAMYVPLKIGASGMKTL
jgi:hypothetical protein